MTKKGNPQKTAEKALNSPPNIARIERHFFTTYQCCTFGSRLLRPEPAPSETACLEPFVHPACADFDQRLDEYRAATGKTDGEK